VVQVEQSIQCVCVSVCADNNFNFDFLPKHLASWFDLTLSVKFEAQGRKSKFKVT